ncbi:MAG: mannose-1-phosphate guanylyltransferase [Candidatus Cyclobacteriaceae bacterium M3_2C_046]
MANKNYVVIMAGGIGSRFWPYSRNNHPKQFLDVLGTGKSLLQMTYDRFLNIAPKENIFVVSNSIYETLIREQLPELSKDQILLEPNRRNTAPCIAYASYKIAKKDNDACIVVTPSDHAIFNDAAFEKAMKLGIDQAKKAGDLITIGIQPNRPETGYGYIQFIDNDSEVKKVKTFTEKPQLDLARKFLESGDFVWNAGIFLFKADTIIKAFEDHLPEMAETFDQISEQYYTDQENDAIREAYSQCKNISIDYGVMEKASNVYVVLGNFGWSDLGSWNSLHEIKKKDENNNVVDANALIYESKNCLVKGSPGKLIVVQGLDGYLVTDCDDVVLICQKDKESKFRQFVSDVRSIKGQDFI